MMYYLNPYLPAIRCKDGSVFFPLSGGGTYAGEALAPLLSGDGMEEEELMRRFGEETVKRWCEAELLLPRKIDPSGRYSRVDSFCHWLHLPGWQKKMEGAKVLILGCGGLGSHIAWNLAAMGAGHVYLVDGDTVEETNLNRQLLYDMEDLGKPKVLCLGQKLKKINPNCRFYPLCQRIGSKEELQTLVENIRPGVLVKALDSPIYISEWVDAVAEATSTRYVSGIMNGTKQFLGPTYIGQGSARFGDFFSIDTDMEKIAGIAPSLSFELSGMAAELSEEIFKLVVGSGTLQFKNKVVERENITGTYAEITNTRFEVERNRTSPTAHMLALTLVYGLLSALRPGFRLAFAAVLIYAAVVPLLTALSRKEALWDGAQLFIFAFLVNYGARLLFSGAALPTGRDVLVYLSVALTVLSVLLLVYLGLEAGLWSLRTRIVKRRRKQ